MLTRTTIRRLVYACGFCASLTSILLGYDVGIMSTATQFIDEDLGLSTVQDELIRSSLNIIAAFGGAPCQVQGENFLFLSIFQLSKSLIYFVVPTGLIAGRTADHLGRNRAIGVACLIFLGGSLIMTCAWSFETLLLGRLITVRHIVTHDDALMLQSYCDENGTCLFLLQGLGVGCGFVIAPVYIAEITPSDIRGR